MFSWLAKLTDKLDHPMSTLAKASAILEELPKVNAAESLEEITTWLKSVTDTPGFKPQLRMEIIKLLDETGQPFHSKLLKAYLAAPSLQDFQGMHNWKIMRLFSIELARAYQGCLDGWGKAEEHPDGLPEELALLSARLLHACTEHLKLDLMRYVDVDDATWERMFRCYREAEHGDYARTSVSIYQSIAGRSTPKQEMMRALALFVSSPSNLTTEQIEVCSRIASRMVSYFDLSSSPDISSEYYIDLAKPGAPAAFDDSIIATPNTRYFSPLRALPQIAAIVAQREQDASGEERRFGSEFSSHGKLAVLKHLMLHWNKRYPRRAFERRSINTQVEVAGGFSNICYLVPRSDPKPTFGLTQADAAALVNRLSSAAAGAYQPSFLITSDASLNGIGGNLPKTAAAWAKVGCLCALKARNVPTWWVGVIRRMGSAEQGEMHAGIEILSKKSLSAWLRFLGSGSSGESEWDSNTGSFKYSYIPAILLPDAHNSFQEATLLMQKGSFGAGKVFEILLGENPREIELARLLGEGDDYEWVEFRWLMASYEK